MTKEKRTAFYVVHGIGEQDPYATLDQYARYTWDTLDKMGIEVHGNHRVRKRDGWMDNYIELKTIDKAGTVQYLDFHEYYWAHLPQQAVEFTDIYNWLLKTSEGAKEYYEENANLVGQYESDDHKAFGDAGFEPHHYLKQLPWLIRAFPFMRYIPVPSWVEAIVTKCLNEASKVFVSHVGDVVAYSNTDIKSETYEVRRNILNGAIEHISPLITDDNYDQIVICGHSLGSVISYDMLNRLNLKAHDNVDFTQHLKRVKGLVTFGSPLDKIAFFFREHTPDEQDLRRQILHHFHGFKSKDLDPNQINLHALRNPFKPVLEHVHWMNFYDTNDPVSGSLDFYRVDENIKVKPQAWGISHVKYWENLDMHKAILEQHVFEPENTMEERLREAALV